MGFGVSSTGSIKHATRTRSKSQVQTLNSTCCTVSRAFCPITSRIHLFRVRTHRLSSKFEIELILGYAAARSASSTKSVDFRRFTVCAYARLGNSYTFAYKILGFGCFGCFRPIFGVFGVWDFEFFAQKIPKMSFSSDCLISISAFPEKLQKSPTGLTNPSVKENVVCRRLDDPPAR